MSKLSGLQHMLRKLLPLLVIGLSGVIVVPVSSNQAKALTPLTRAVIQDLRNLVQLMPKNQPRRKALLSDAIVPGDGLSTGRSSLADLRFNDGSLARVGEQAVFQFLPRTRKFTLNNGTVLLLIPPGKGRTNIKTPSAAAAIRGSALFVRYDKVTDTTTVGALTNSGIEVFNKDNSASQVLKAGQMMVVVKGKFQGLYEFDLRNFYDNSDLVRGLDLNRQTANSSKDPAINSVRAETMEALEKQSPVAGPDTIQNPSFLDLSPTPQNSDISAAPEAGNSPAESLLDSSQIQSGRTQRGNNDSTNTGNSTVMPPKQDSPVTPPKQDSPVTPPKQDSPVTPPNDNTVTPPKQESPVTPPKDNTVTPPKQDSPVTPPKQESPVTPPKQDSPVTPPSDNTPPPKQEIPPPPKQEIPPPPKQETPPPKQETPPPPKQETPPPKDNPVTPPSDGTIDPSTLPPT